MKNNKMFFLSFLCLGYLKSMEGSPTIVSLSQNLKAGNIRVKCNFTLVFTKTDVDLEKSSVLCNKDARGKKAKVDTKTDEGYIFKGLIQPPNKIVKMTGGDYFEDFMDQRIAEDPEDEGEAACGGFIDDNKRQRGFVHKSFPLWPNSEVTYSFVSDGTDQTMNDAAFYVDEKVGFNAEEMAVIVKAMKEIEAETCITFQHVTPTQGKPWVLIMREGRKEPKECYAEYIKESLGSKTIGDLGQPFSGYYNSFCFNGKITIFH